MRVPFYLIFLSVIVFGCSVDSESSSSTEFGVESLRQELLADASEEIESKEEISEYQVESVECKQGEEETFGDSYEDEYTQRTDSCKWGNLMIATTFIKDMNECKFGCEEKEYHIRQRNGEYKKASLKDLFDFELLLPKINGGLKTSFATLKNQLPDCFEGIHYEERTIGDLSFGITEGSMIFLSNTGVAKYCQGPGGYISVSFSLKEMREYLKFN